MLFNISGLFSFTWDPEYRNDGTKSTPADNGEGLARSLLYQELERKRISRELHDGLGQLLTNIGMRVQRHISEHEKSIHQNNSESNLEMLSSINQMVNEAINEVRSICADLHPVILEDLGLLAAITCKCRQCREALPGLALETNLQVNETDIPVEFKTTIYRVVQEALNNALKYSRAEKIWLAMVKRGTFIHLHLSDDGCGFDTSEVLNKMGELKNRHHGLRYMQERIESLGGQVFINSQPGQGTEIEFKLPLQG